MSPTQGELNAMVKLLDSPGWEGPEDLAKAVYELVDKQQDKRWKYVAVCQALDPRTGRPHDFKAEEGFPAGHVAAFTPQSTYLKADAMALQLIGGPTSLFICRAWVLPFWNGSPTTWRQSVYEKEHK